MDNTPDDADEETQRYVYVASPVNSQISQTTEVLETPQQTPPQSPPLALAQDSQQSSSSTLFQSLQSIQSPQSPQLNDFPPYVSPVRSTPTQSPLPPPSPPPSEPIDPSQSPMSSAVQPTISVSQEGGRATSANTGCVGVPSSPPRSVSMASSEGVIVTERVGGASDPFQEELRYTNTIWTGGYVLNTAGWTVEGLGTPLYDTDKLISLELDSNVLSLLDDSMRAKFAFNPSKFYLDLFFRWQFFKKRKAITGVNAVGKTISWNKFVIQFSESPVSWIEKYLASYQNFMAHTMIGPMMKVHEESVKHHFSCAVPSELNCPFCYKESTCMSGRMRSDPRLLPGSLLLALEQLDNRIATTPSAASALENQELRRENEDLRRQLGFVERAPSALSASATSQASTSIEIVELRQENRDLHRQNEDLRHQIACLEQFKRQRAERPNGFPH